MRLLLDTHIFVWLLVNPEKLSLESRRTLESTPASHLCVSHISVWEIAIKHARGKLPLPKRFFESLSSFNVSWIPHKTSHVLAYLSLPFHHYDPFDRMLIAQAKDEKLTLVSRDKEISMYHREIDLLLA